LQNDDVRDSVLHKFALGCSERDPITKNITLPVRHNRVFIATALWDHNYHHFLVDSVARIVRHLKFLHDNPDIKIHIRRFESKAKKQHIIKSGIEMRQRIWKALNISLDRIISGPVLASEVFLPRAPLCNAPIQHALELRILANLLLPPQPTPRALTTSSTSIALPSVEASISKAGKGRGRKRTRGVVGIKEKKNLIIQQFFVSVTAVDKLKSNLMKHMKSLMSKREHPQSSGTYVKLQSCPMKKIT
jgi:hypothetical protein